MFVFQSLQKTGKVARSHIYFDFHNDETAGLVKKENVGAIIRREWIFYLY